VSCQKPPDPISAPNPQPCPDETMKLVEVKGLTNGADHCDDPKSERIVISLPLGLLKSIQDYRFGNRINSQSAAVRRLIELGLQKAS
jgi:hypothetical protein